ncbi:MAG: hypothetical protein K2Y16_11550 [Burkholderiales bacterium]|nr:hypothetical protein [Burkholderiales bacterium]
MRDAILVHNHPNSTSLSRADLQLAGKSGLKAVVAVGHDGSQYIASAIVRERLLRYYDVADRHAYTAIRGLIASGHASIAEANRWHHHAVNKGLARAGIMDYRAAAR